LDDIILEEQSAFVPGRLCLLHSRVFTTWEGKRELQGRVQWNWTWPRPMTM
jgi:hypothetical protein